MGADCCNLAICPTRIAGTRQSPRSMGLLAINAVMFAVEIGAGLAAGSAALQADALDFLGDAAKASTMAGTEPPRADVLSRVKQRSR